jgi:hypothetical protein
MLEIFDNIFVLMVSQFHIEAVQLYYRNPRPYNVTYAEPQDHQSLDGLLGVLYKRGPSLDIPTFFRVIHRNSSHDLLR